MLSNPELHHNSAVFPTAATTLMASRAEGIYIYDQTGKRYLDSIAGTRVASIGYGVPEIAEAMAKQAQKVTFVNKLQFTTEAQEQLAQTILQLSPPNMAKVAFVTGGSSANEIALIFARYYHLARGKPNKHKIIARWQSYHGRTMATMSMSGSQFVKRDNLAPYQLDFPHINIPHCYHCPLQKTYPSCQLACADELATMIEQQGADTIAAFIAEPISGGSGSGITPPAGYYERIREICDHYDILFISEEIITGYGRTGKNFGIQHWNTTPDIITAAKGLGGGYVPIGSVTLHQKIWDALVADNKTDIPATFTYSGHPISCATALAVQTYIAQHQLIERCAQRGNYLHQRLQELAQRQPLIGEVRGKGLLLGVEFIKNPETREAFPREQRLTEKLTDIALQKGLIISGRFGTSTQRNGDHILFSPAFTITEEQCDELITLFEQAIETLKQTVLLHP